MKKQVKNPKHYHMQNKNGKIILIGKIFFNAIKKKKTSLIFIHLYIVT